jgi:sigma-B regulation protein RsbU (phosphoserine phosphatase)
MSNALPTGISEEKKQKETPRILMVDDNPQNLQVLHETLKGRGYSLLAAKSGDAALSIAARANPQLILLDIMMPGIDGYEVCRRLKEDPARRDTPVIFLSALSDTKDKVRGLDLGAVDFITKPFQPEEVIARVNTHLTIHRLRREVEEKKQELERELESVAQEQRSLLPKELPEIEGVKLSTYYQTSRYAGGDYYDVIELPDDHWGFMMADAAGHSTRAAVLMAMACALLRSYPKPPFHPGEVLRDMNANLCKLKGDLFVTALYFVYHPASKTFRLARAGHPPPLIYRPSDGKTAELECEGTYPMAIYPYEDVPVTEGHLRPGDRLMLYTDGIVEQSDLAGELYGQERLSCQLARDDIHGPQEMLDAIIADVRDFAGGLPNQDDQAVIMAFIK